MRRAKAFRKPETWVVRLVQPNGAMHDYRFGEWTDALAWAVRMVGLHGNAWYTTLPTAAVQEVERT